MCKKEITPEEPENCGGEKEDRGKYESRRIIIREKGIRRNKEKM